MVGEKISFETAQPRLGNGLAFFLGFLRRPHLVASVIPSSRFLVRRLADVAPIREAGLVVELGPGTGCTTQALLDDLNPSARLLAIEINPEFVSILNVHPDSRLLVQHGDALRIGEALARHSLARPDVVVSGIPFSTMSADLGHRILKEVWSCLAPGGHFVAYQFRDRVAALGRQLWGPPKVAVELRNLPPMRLYCWRKPLSEPRSDPASRARERERTRLTTD
jgi:phosphatidylethanolamine/phosphatidyl-N-methylethanolamine N-methyltransferase